MAIPTIDLRKESPSTKYDQRFIAHYCGHHMTCGNSSTLFKELQILEYIKTEIERHNFDHDAYTHFCWALDIQPAKQYKPMSYFDACVHIGTDDRKDEAPDITVFTSKAKTDSSLILMQKSSNNEMYFMTLAAWDMKHAYEQVWAICKENFS